MIGTCFLVATLVHMLDLLKQLYLVHVIYIYIHPAELCVSFVSFLLMGYSELKVHLPFKRKIIFL